MKKHFSDHWDNFIKPNLHLTIRNVIFKEVHRMISYHTSELENSVFEYPNCDEIKFSCHTNLDFVLLVTILCYKRFPIG